MTAFARAIGIIWPKFSASVALMTGTLPCRPGNAMLRGTFPFGNNQLELEA